MKKIQLQQLFRRPYCYSKSSTKWIPPLGHDTGIKVYNCIVKEKVPLILRNKNLATFYTCGPTVYDASHIGHASCYVKLDIIQRILKDYFKINLLSAINITDIDDKIIKKSQETGQDWTRIAQQNEAEFWDDLHNLAVSRPNFIVKVSDYIPEIIAFIEKLMLSGYAYRLNDNSVYFKVKNYPNYGKLVKINIDDEKNEEKESNADFALWKGAKPGEPSWPSPWGNGRPGWHIECSTMASTLFGSSIDFHAGGLDLRFPHHENEEAQSCCHHNVDQWVNYWLHTGQLHVKGQQEKMSKSLKNTIGVKELLKNYKPDEFRMLCLLSNYRNSVEFSDEGMKTAQGVLNKFQSFLEDASAFIEGTKPRGDIDANEIFIKINETIQNVDNAFRDDFNTAKSISNFLELISFLNRQMNSNVNQQDLVTPYHATINPSIIKFVHDFILKHMQCFGLETFSNLTSHHTDRVKNQNINMEIILNEIINIRNELRETAAASKHKELFKLADKIRDNLKINGIQIKDHGKSSSWFYNK